MSGPSTQIYYGLVSFGKIVLCDSELVPGSYEPLCQSALDDDSSKESEEGSIREYMKSRFCIYVYSSKGLHYVCVTSMTFKRSLIVNCLSEVEERFRKQGLDSRAKEATPYSLRSSFSSSLHSILSKHSSQDHLSRVEQMVDETRGIIAGKVVKAVEQRASNVCDMEERTSALHLSGIHFNPNMPDHIHRKRSFCCCY